MRDGAPPADPSGDDLAESLRRIETLASQQVSEIGWFSDWTKPFQQIEDIVDGFVRQQISRVPQQSIKNLIDVIKGRREKLSLSSGITNQIVGICQQILAFGAAGLALTIGFIDKVKQFSIAVQKLLAVVGIFYFELVLVALLVLIWYMLQARFRYPSIYFEKIGNAWPFFYYAKITPVWRWPLQTSTQRFQASVTYATDMMRFTDLVLNEDERERLRAELQQYFLLMSYQAYVHQFALRLASLFMYGFISAVITALLMLLAWLGGVL